MGTHRHPDVGHKKHPQARLEGEGIREERSPLVPWSHTLLESEGDPWLWACAGRELTKNWAQSVCPTAVGVRAHCVAHSLSKADPRPVLSENALWMPSSMTETSMSPSR